MRDDTLIRNTKNCKISYPVIVSLLIFPEVLSSAVRIPWREATFAFVPPPPLPALDPISGIDDSCSLGKTQHRRSCFPLRGSRGVGWTALGKRWDRSYLGDFERDEDFTLSRFGGDVRCIVKNAAVSGCTHGDNGDDDAIAAAAAPAENVGDTENVQDLSRAASMPAPELEAEVASFAFSPAMTVKKFKTLQDRRVPVNIKYSGGGGFKRFFEEVTKVLKERFPDVLISREVVEVKSSRGEQVFEIRIDGKLVCAKRRGKAGVFLRMETVEQAVKKARRRQRPGAIVYGDHETYRNARSLDDSTPCEGPPLEEDA